MPSDPTNPTYNEMARPPKMYSIDELIAGYGSSATLSTIKTGLVADLPFECPKCRNGDGHGTGLITVTPPGGSPVQIECDICTGVGKLAEEKSAVCVQYEYQ